MKRCFRQLILGFIIASLCVLTACQEKKENFKEHEEITSKEVTTTVEETTTEEATTTKKEEIVYNNYVVVSDEAKIYSSTEAQAQEIGKVYKNSIIQAGDSEDVFWKNIKIDEDTKAYISIMDIKFVGSEYIQYEDYQIVDNSNKYATVNVDVGNIRDLPSMDGEVLGKYNYGQVVEILGVTKNNWNMIKYNGIICYISTDIIEYMSKEEYDIYNLKPEKVEFDERKADLIGTYTTNYAPANTNRGYNIELGAKMLDCLVIQPGALFDWCRDMGQCGKKQGFKESIEISNGEYVTGYGGGICQISSTLCASILTSQGEFEFVQRRKHSKAQKYIPREYDATVSYPNANFVFKNCNEQPILIKADCEDGNLIIKLYTIK